MGWGAFTEFVQDCKVCDDQQCQMKDVDTVFIASNVSGGHEELDRAQRARNPDRSLTRYEFIEAVVRCSIQKYFNRKANDALREPSVSAALRRFVEKHVLPRAQYDRHATSFRKEALWREEVDTVVKEKLPQLTKLYRNFRGRYALPGEVKFMSVEEFCEMLEGAGLLSGTQNEGGEPGANVLGGFGEREVKLCFVYAMQPVVDELATDKHRQMHFIEFIEAVARVAHTHRLLEVADPGEWRGADPMKAPLAVRLKNLFDVLFDRHQHVI